MNTGFYCGILRKRGHLENPGVDERIILRWTFRKLNGAVDWIDVARDMNKWRPLVNAVMNLRVP